MDSEDVCIVEVEADTDCVCLSSIRRSKVDCIEVRAKKGKGKEPANLSRPLTRKRTVKQRDESDDVVIVDLTKHQRSYKPDCSDFDCIIPPLSLTSDGPPHQTTGDQGTPQNPPSSLPSSALSSTSPLCPDDEELARQLQAQELASADSATLEQIHSDEQLAKQLMLTEIPGKTVSRVSQPTSLGSSSPTTTLSNTQSNILSGSNTLNSVPSGSSTQSNTPSGSNTLNSVPSGSNTQSDTPSGSSTQNNTPSGSNTLNSVPSGSNTQSKPLNGLDRLPTCWTTCPKCLPTDKRRYHLIDVAPGSSEWQVVSESLTNANFTVHKVQRVQNESLWQRLMFEKNLMLRERDDVNMQLLYHTTRAKASVICEEGLDLRLSRNGRFGSGIYFSDDPAKCNSYWPSVSGLRQMFVCRVLLGDIKVYPDNQCDTGLVREPLKEQAKPGEPKTYDSVKGRISGQNEYIVYNAYRVMPEYLLEYSVRSGYTAPPLTAAALYHQMSLHHQHRPQTAIHVHSGHQRRRGRRRKN